MSKLTSPRNVFLSLSVLGFLSFLLGTPLLVRAQTAPNFALKITRSIDTPSGSTQVIDWYYSNDGTFTFPVSVSLQDLSGEQSLGSQELTGFGLYVRGEADFFPSGGPVRVDRVVTGNINVTKPAGENFISRVAAPFSYPYSGWDCQTFNGPSLWSACVSGPDAHTADNSLSYVDQYGYNAVGSPQPNRVQGYMATPYWAVGAGSALTHEVAFRCDPRYGTHSCTVAGISGNADSTVSVTASVGTLPAYIKQPGDNPGPTENFRCGSDDDGSGDDGGGSGGSGSGNGGTPAAQGALNLATGNLLVMVEDPVRTRGFPLRNRIFLNSQVVELNRPMGNATFTYDIHVLSPAMSGQTRWMIIDGDGKRLDYGTGASPVGALGNYATFAQTGSGYLVSNADAPEKLRSAGNYRYEFDQNGKLLTVTDPAGNVQTLSYTGNQLASVTDLSSAKQLTFGWTNGHISSITENGGAQTLLGYTSLGRLQSLTLQDSAYGTARSITLGYDANGSWETITRDGEASSAYSLFNWYTPTGVPMTRIRGQGRSILPLYNSYTGGAPYARVILPNQKAGNTIYELDSHFDVTKIIYPSLAGSTAGATFTMGYDANRNLISWSDGATSKTYDYEANGLLKKITRSDGSFLQYNWSGADLQSIADSLGTLASFVYGNSSLPHTATAYSDGASNTWTLARNSFGQLTGITPPTGSQTGSLSFTYDEQQTSASYGWLTKITDALGNETRFDSFTSQGKATAISTDPDPSTPSSRITENRAFDAAGRLRALTHADGKSQVFSYTGRKLAYTDDEAATRTSFTYCPSCDALQTETTPLGHTLRWDVDPDLQQTKYTDARLNYTAYVYGQAKELLGESYPDGTTHSYLYDGSYRPRKFTNGRLQETNYSYDALGRLYQVSYPTTSEPTETISYRADDEVLSVTDAAGTTGREYFANRLLKAEVFNYVAAGLPSIQRVEYEYYPDNLLKKITWKNGASVVGTWDYTYDAAGRMQSVTSFGQTNTFVYDGEGKIVNQLNFNGTSISTAWNDERRWPTSITHKKQGVPFASYALQYDAGSNTIGNLSLVTELSGGTVSYSYDALYRLTGETRAGAAPYSKSYGYDLAGNLTLLDAVTFASYDAANKITALNGGSIAHDGDGDVLSVTAGNIPASAFSWNTKGKLTSLTSGVTGVTYTYDALGRRVRQVQGTTKRFYIFAGDKLLGEIQSNLPQVAYTWGPDGLVSERLFRVQYIAVAEVSATNEELLAAAPVSQVDDETALSGYANETALTAYDVIAIPTVAITLWYHYGPQGETRYLTDLSGNVTDSYQYDAYGIPVATTGTFYNPHRYGGKYGYHSNLNPAGLVLAGARWYSPQLRRWVSRDPIAYEGGENLYGYVGGRPVGYVDPEGLDARNYSQNSIWVKPEEGRPFRLPANSWYEGPVDGVNPSEDGRGDWYKVIGHGGDAKDISICKDGRLITSGGRGWGLLHTWIPDILPILTDRLPGWKSEPGWTSRHEDWKIDSR